MTDGTRTDGPQETNERERHEQILEATGRYSDLLIETAVEVTNLRELLVQQAKWCPDDVGGLLVDAHTCPECGSLIVDETDHEPGCGGHVDRREDTPRADERCSCGWPADRVYLTETHGRIAWCGRRTRYPRAKVDR